MSDMDMQLYQLKRVFKKILNVQIVIKFST